MNNPLNLPVLTFTAAQAERLTDVSVDKQRDWRRRGILPGNDGARWTRFNAVGLIHLAFIAEAQRAGLELKEASRLGDEALRPALAHAIAQDATGPADFAAMVTRAREGRYVIQAQFAASRDVHTLSSLAALAQIEESGMWEECPPLSLVVIDVHAVVNRLAQRIERGDYRGAADE